MYGPSHASTNMKIIAYSSIKMIVIFIDVSNPFCFCNKLKFSHYRLNMSLHE